MCVCRTELDTEADKIKNIVFDVYLICNWPFVTDKEVESLCFTLKSHNVGKETSQQQLFALINIPSAITVEKGIVAQ